MNWKRVVKEVLIWIPSILLAIMFLNAGIRKFFENGGWTQAFANFGYPAWFRILIGVLETAGALLLLLPRTAAYGAGMIVMIMIGAIGTALAQEGMPLRGIVSPAIALAVAAIVFAVRWSKRWVKR